MAFRSLVSYTEKVLAPTHVNVQLKQQLVAEKGQNLDTFLRNLLQAMFRHSYEGARTNCPSGRDL